MIVRFPLPFFFLFISLFPLSCDQNERSKEEGSPPLPHPQQMGPPVAPRTSPQPPLPPERRPVTRPTSPVEHSPSPNSSSGETLLHLVAMGDLMAQPDLLRGMSTPAHWQEGFAALLPLLKRADLAFGNLETPIAQRHWSDAERKQNRRHRFPVFNAPPTLPAFLKRSGFSIVSVANNHALDQGPQGFSSTLATLKRIGLPTVGGGRKGGPEGVLLRRRGLRIGFLAFTMFTNIKQWTWRLQEHVLHYLHPDNRLQRREALRLIRTWSRKTDLLVVSLHWGVEFSHSPTRQQRRLAYSLMNAGAHILLGHHPHVLQPTARGRKQRGVRPFTIYSMGNAFASMGIRNFRGYRTHQAATNDTLLLHLRVRFSGHKPVNISPSMTPLFLDVRTSGKGCTAKLVDLVKALHDLERQGRCTPRQEHLPCRVYRRRLQHIKRVLGPLPLEEADEIPVVPTENPTRSRVFAPFQKVPPSPGSP